MAVGGGFHRLVQLDPRVHPRTRLPPPLLCTARGARTAHGGCGRSEHAAPVSRLQHLEQAGLRDHERRPPLGPGGRAPSAALGAGQCPHVCRARLRPTTTAGPSAAGPSAWLWRGHMRPGQTAIRAIGVGRASAPSIEMLLRGPRTGTPTGPRVRIVGTSPNVNLSIPTGRGDVREVRGAREASRGRGAGESTPDTHTCALYSRVSCWCSTDHTHHTHTLVIVENGMFCEKTLCVRTAASHRFDSANCNRALVAIRK